MKRIYFLFALTFGQITLFAQQYTSEDIPGVFSVSPHKKVIFSKGNLQACYDGSEYHWRFAAHQYEHIGDAPGNTTIDRPAKGEIVDLFSWSTENNNFGIRCDEQVDYGKFRDWGMLINDDRGWRTLGCFEWEYVCGLSRGYRRNRNERMEFGKPACTIVWARDSLMIDGKICPDGIFLYPDKYNYNEIGKGGPDSWKEIELKGVVFLPGQGYRFGLEIGGAPCGYYWASDYPTANFNYCKFSANHLLVANHLAACSYLRREYGMSVRLVRDYNHKNKKNR